MIRKKATCAALLLASMTSLASAAPEEFIAGVEPAQRPEGAPTLDTMAKDAAWYRRALSGIQPPHPVSFRFLEDQGPWYTPFNRPGMTGPYDIRNWHLPASAEGNQDVVRR